MRPSSMRSPAERTELCRAILDWLRRELAIQVDALNPAYHEQLWLRSNNNLIAPWAIDENEQYSDDDVDRWSG